MRLLAPLLLGSCLILAVQHGGATSSASKAPELYQNYPLYRLHAENEQQIVALQEIEASSDSLIFLDEIHYVDQEANVVVAPHKLPDFLHLLQHHEIRHELLSTNVQRLLQKDKVDGSSQPTGRQVQAAPRLPYNWLAYQELNATYDWLRSLPALYPNISEVITFGHSYEGYELLALKISWPASGGNASYAAKPAIFVESGLHAREWIAPATATYLINELLNSSSPQTQHIARNYDWYIVPHANPDGYVYTHTTDRLWRKNRRPYGPCFGVDPNRNWDYFFDNTRSQPCAPGYAGPEPFSEVEVRSLAAFIASLQPAVKLYLSLHSYSQLLMYPYGYTATLPENVLDLHQVGLATVAALRRRFGTAYRAGNINRVIQPAFGSSVDWAYGRQHINMSFCFELRPRRENSIIGHKLPAEQIVPTAQETLDGLIAMIAEVKRLKYFEL